MIVDANSRAPALSLDEKYSTPSTSSPTPKVPYGIICIYETSVLPVRSQLKQLRQPIHDRNPDGAPLRASREEVEADELRRDKNGTVDR